MQPMTGKSYRTSNEIPTDRVTSFVQWTCILVRSVCRILC